MLSPSTVPDAVPALARPSVRPASEPLQGEATDPVPSDPIAIDVVLIDPVAQPARFAAAMSAAGAAAARELADFAAEQLMAQADRVRAWSTARTLSDIIRREWAFAAETFSAFAHEAIHLHQVMAAAAREADRTRDRRKA